MKYKSLSILVILLFSFSAITSQNKDKSRNSFSKFEHSVGAAAGFSTGYGLSYRVYKNRMGAQLTFSPYKTEDITRHSLGVTFLYKLDQRKNTDLFIYQGNHYLYKRNHKILYNQYNDSIESDFIHGLGLGMSFNIIKPLCLSLMAGYAAHDSYSKYNITVEAAIFYVL